MDQDMITKSLKTRINELEETLCISEDEAKVLLSSFKYKTDVIEEKWFENEEKIKLNNGLKNSAQQQQRSLEKDKCAICREQVESNNISTLSCKHSVCNDCWRA